MERILESDFSTCYAFCDDQSGIKHKEFSDGI